jgi:hypothetical protein
MELSLLLIVIGIILALLVNYAVGLACFLIGLVLLIWPRLLPDRPCPPDLAPVAHRPLR